MEVRILTFFMLLQIVVATQDSLAPPVVKFAPAQTTTPYVIDIIVDLKYCPIGQ
jgi:hypothetical protein